MLEGHVRMSLQEGYHMREEDVFPVTRSNIASNVACNDDKLSPIMLSHTAPDHDGPCSSAWAQTHLCWTRQDCQKVLFIDELRFCLTRGDGRICVYCRRNECYTEACTLERDQFGGGGSIMVWGSVSQHHRTELVVIAGNLNAVCHREDILLHAGSS